ncbi:MAG TPA: hypothetical protein VFJ53_04260 [Solirubrobacterales bacterium]|nr:hypothetical protein [Solirubrobacterales bacterium]
MLEFDAEIGPEPRRLWIKGHSEEAAAVTPHADSALAMSLVPAMTQGGVLQVEGAVSPRVLRMQREFQGIERAWSQVWNSEAPPLEEVAVEAGTRSVPAPNGDGRVAAFFSGGVDSWATLLSEPEITDVIFLKGADILPNLTPLHVGLGERVESVLGGVAEELGKQLHVVEFNVREFSEPFVDWGFFFNSPLCAVALYFESLFDRVLIPSDTNHANQPPYGSARMIDGLWSSEALEIADHGGRLTRFERIQLIAPNPLVQRSLRVCYMNHDQLYNCGRCPKCNFTMICLEALGLKERFTTFPDEFDFTVLEDYVPAEQIHLVLWEEGLHGVEQLGREDLAAVILPLVERGRRNLTDPALIAAEEEAAAARGEAAAAQAKLREVFGSSSWRLTEPLRRAGAAARRARAAR